jgi:hypothetical protein
VIASIARSVIESRQIWRFHPACGVHFSSFMLAPLRHTSSSRLSITTTPVSQAPWLDHAVELYVVTTDEVDEGAAAVAVASMCRSRRAEHEEIWAQLFIDGVFVDLVRAVDLTETTGSELATFLARIDVPAVYFDGEAHRAQVKFLTTVSRIVPAGTTASFTGQELEANVEAEFAAFLRHRT